MSLLFWLIISTFFLSLILTLLIKKAATFLKILDYPGIEAGKKIHTKAIPLLGGGAIFLSFFLIVFLLSWLKPDFITHLKSSQLLAVFFASLILMIGGFFDDKYNLAPKYQIIFPLLAVLLVVVVGTNLKEITNPLGGKFNVRAWQVGGHFLLVDVIVFVWLIAMSYTTKILDGLDGLVAGLTVIGSLMIGFLSLTQKFYQADIAWLAFLFAAANLGFLIFNFHPAKIFLGEGGSLFTGFILGILAIMAGGKIATALLVMGLALIDIVFVVFKRLSIGSSPFVGDGAHLHHRLLSIGFTHRQAVFLFYSFAIIFGVLTLVLQSRGKFLALLILFILAIFIGLGVDIMGKKYVKSKN